MARGDFLRAVGLALFIGGVGGALATWLRLPLAWMIGSMLATTLAAVIGLPVRLPMKFRTVMVAVLGVMLGSSFSPEMLGLLGEWTLSLSFLVPYIALSAAAALLVFRRLAGYDRVTAYFAAMPGGLSEMILVGGAMGGDERKISLSHAARILIVVLIVPFAFRWLYPNSVGGGLSPFGNDGALSLSDAVILIACGVIGYLSARLARIPAAAVVGPMIASAIVHLSGWTAARPPVELIAFAQVVMGTAVGCRFTGTKAREVLDALRNALFGTAALLTVTLIVAGVLQNLTGLPLASLILAFSPGGLAEMSLIALSLEVDPAFVSTHHIVRICLVVIFAPLAFKLLWRGK